MKVDLKNTIQERKEGFIFWTAFMFFLFDFLSLLKKIFVEKIVPQSFLKKECAKLRVKNLG